MSGRAPFGGGRDEMMSMTRRFGVALAVILPALTIAWAPPALADAGAVWAWATVRHATTDALIPNGVDAGSWNSGGASVHRVETGHYQVTFYGAQENGSGPDIALVSPIGSTARTCAVVDWERVTSSEVVEVKCQTLDGTPRDSQFVVQWLAAAGTGGRLGYAFNWNTTSDGGSPDEVYNSTGGFITIHPMNQTAELRFEGQGVDGGVVIVSATDRIRTEVGSFPTSCTLLRLITVLNTHNTTNTADDTLDTYSDVKCWETNGAANIYHEHFVVFMKGLGLKGVTRTRVAYLWARHPKKASYGPSWLDRYNSSGHGTPVRRLGTGRYDVTFLGMPKGGGAQVTAVGDARRVCTIAGISRTVRPPHVKVSCFDGSGSPVDSQFTLAYTR
jgi:hypothetical protein